MRISLSQVTAYVSNPTAFVARFQRTRHTGSSGANVYWTAVIQALAAYHKAYPRSPDRMMEAYEHAWLGLRGKGWPGYTRNQYETGRGVLLEYHQVNRHSSARSVQTNWNFRLPVGPHLLTGVIHRVDMGNRAYAATTFRPRADALSDEVRLQASQIALQREHLTIEEVTLYFLDANQTHVTHFDEQQLSRAEGRLIRIIDEIERLPP